MTPDGNISSAASCALSAKSTSLKAPAQRRFWQRWLVRDIWRAFPELDRFPDDACAALVQMTRNSAAYQFARLLNGAFTAALAGASAWKTTSWLMTTDGFSALQSAGLRNAATQLIGAAALLAAATAAPLLLGRLFAHALLHDRLAKVLRFDGRCRQCGYSLLGLELGQTMELPCPECGHVAVVDRALAALVGEWDAAGHRGNDGIGRSAGIVCVFRPDIAWQRQRDLRLAKKALVLLALGLVPAAIAAMVLAAWLGYGVMAASAATPAPAAYSTAVQPHLHGLTLTEGCSWSNDASSIRNAWMWIYREETRDDLLLQQLPFESFDIPARLWLERTPSVDTCCTIPNARAHAYRVTAAALQYLFEEQHASTLAPAVAAAPLQLDRGWLDPTDEAAMARAAEDAEALRVTAERCESMMRLAAVHKKVGVALQALDAGLLCTVHLSCQPTPQSYEHAAELNHFLAMDIVEWLAHAPDDAPLDALRQAWDQHSTLRDPFLVIEWATLDHQRQVCRDLARLDVLLMSLWGPVPAGQPGGGTQRLGTVAQCRDVLEQQRQNALDATVLQAIPSAWLQPASTSTPLPETLADRYVNDLRKVAAGWAQHREDRESMPVHFAIAQFRIAHGHYPADLRELVPQYLPAIPDLTTADGLARHYTQSGDRYALSP